jgi:hypothetical protein
MLILPKLTREIQLGWFKPDCVISQDQELINFINLHNYHQALGYGDVEYFKSHIKLVDCGPVDLAICIVNQSFDFVDLLQTVNEICRSHLNPKGIIYLSLNKYLAVPSKTNKHLSDDYDLAIEQYVSQNVDCAIEQYLPCNNDRGDQFNWAHPLTRFYLRKP